MLLTCRKTDEGDRTGHRPSCFLRSKRQSSTGPGRATQGLAADITSERHNHFGASAPVANPQKTGIAHSSATAGDARAAFILNGESLGLLPCVSGPRCGVGSRRWKAPWGSGLKDRTPHWPD